VLVQIIKIAYNTGPNSLPDTYSRKGRNIRSGNSVTIIIIIFGVGDLIVIAYAPYRLFPLFKTIQGGLQVLTEYGEQVPKTIQREYDSIPSTQQVSSGRCGDQCEEEQGVRR
jgi:hypothetical protein